MIGTNDYPCLEAFSREVGISSENLVAAFTIEQRFHHEILSCSDPLRRRRLYAEVYAAVHPLLRSEIRSGTPRIVRLFRRELFGKSILDVGCGSGEFLQVVHATVPHKELWGLDTSTVYLPEATDAIRFVQADIVDFRTDRPFDVVFSNQVFEHIAPADVPLHLASIRNSLCSGGALILCLPNRLWGPGDITCIVDNTYSGKIASRGTHLNESTYSEMIALLSKAGFWKVRTVLPFAYKFPVLGFARVAPVLNRCAEVARVRKVINHVRLRGKPLFKNPIILVCRKREG